MQKTRTQKSHITHTPRFFVQCAGW